MRGGWCWAASLHCPPVVTTKYLQTLSNDPWGQNPFGLRSTDLGPYSLPVHSGQGLVASSELAFPPALQFSRSE